MLMRLADYMVAYLVERMRQELIEEREIDHSTLRDSGSAPVVPPTGTRDVPLVH